MVAGKSCQLNIDTSGAAARSARGPFRCLRFPPTKSSESMILTVA